MNRGVGRVYKHSQWNQTYLSPNTSFVVSPHYLNTTPYSTKGGGILSPENLIQTKPLSTPKSKNKLDTALNIYDKL